MGKDRKNCRNDKYRRKYKKYKALAGRQPIFNSNTRNSYINLNGGQYLMQISGNALQIFAKDPSGQQNLYGYIKLDLANTIPFKRNFTSNNISVRYTVAPYRCIYIDLITTWWPLSGIAQNFYDIIDAGFNIINVCFMVDGQPADIALAWIQSLSAIDNESGSGKTYQQEILEYAHTRGCSILLSSGGATETPYNTDPVVYAQRVCNYAISGNFDGVDYDLENFGPGLTGAGLTSQQTIDWLVTVANTTRTTLGTQALISFAPQAPYLSTPGQSATWAGVLGGFTAVYNAAPSIDIYNIQFYNQGNTNYQSYQTIFINSGTDFPYSAVTQQQPYIPLNKFSLGKPLRVTDASTGYMSPQDINSVLIQAKNNLGFIGNVFTWQWPADEPNPKQYVTTWLQTVTAGL